MQIRSMSSFAFSMIGIIFVGLSFLLENFVEYVFTMGLLFLLLAVVVSVRAITKAEEGKVKWVAIAVTFLVLLVISVFAPFHFIRLFTWINHWPLVELSRKIFSGVF